MGLTPAEELYRAEWGRILATLIRILGDFDLAEEVAQEAFVAAIEQWPHEGVPDQPRAWIVRAARNKAVDRLRRRARFEDKQRLMKADALVAQLEAWDADPTDRPAIDDDRLRLIFTCCHPALATEAQVALTLRTLCGLTTEHIARAFLVAPTTMAQRLVRAKKKIQHAGIAYEVPGPEALAERLEAVQAVIYLVFTEGHSASEGSELVRTELCDEAIRLGRLLAELMPERPEPEGLLALMLLTHARRHARATEDGEIVLLADQDRTLWDRPAIEEGLERVERALTRGRPTSYALQAAIAAVHARAERAEDTDWRQIAGLYQVLARLHPSPVVELNRAVAVAMVDGPAAGLRLADAAGARGDLDGYLPFHAARADLLRRMGRDGEAEEAYRRALELAGNDTERRFLSRRLREVGAGPGPKP